MLLKRGADIHAKSATGASALHAAAAEGRAGAVAILLAHDAAADDVDIDGESALHFAGKISHAATAAALLALRPELALARSIDGALPDVPAEASRWAAIEPVAASCARQRRLFAITALFRRRSGWRGA